MKTAVLWNPRGGRGRAAKKRPQAEEMLAGLAPRWVETVPGQITQQARDLAEEGFEVVVGAGGDGTVSQVAAGLVGTSARLALLPLGTGNDLARHLAIGTSLAVACRAITEGKVVAMDAAQWESRAGSGTFINVAGCGFDAAVAEAINQRFRHVSGTTAYLLAILSTLRSYRPIEVEVEIDGERIQEEAMLCAVANASSYGGGLRIAPVASVTDGVLDVVLVGKLSKAQFLANFPRILKGTHLSHPQVSHWRGRHVVLRSRAGTPFLADGELFEGGQVSVEALPGAISVLVPD